VLLREEKEIMEINGDKCRDVIFVDDSVKERLENKRAGFVAEINGKNIVIRMSIGKSWNTETA